MAKLAMSWAEWARLDGVAVAELVRTRQIINPALGKFLGAFVRDLFEMIGGAALVLRADVDGGRPSLRHWLISFCAESKSPLASPYSSRM